MNEPEQNEVLYGHGTTQRLVAVETSDKDAVLFTRTMDGTLAVERRPFIPWILCDRERHFEGATTTQLSGSGHPYLIEFESGWSSSLDAKRSLRADHANLVTYTNPVRHFLSRTGETLFKGMAFDHLLRMQVDIETTSLDPHAPGAGIFLIAISDNRGFSEALVGAEATILRDLMSIVSERDPDVLEGHNIYGFDLPYILARCEASQLKPTLGREGRTAYTGRSRNCALGANTRPFSPVHIYGRHILDTYLQVQRFDIAKGQLSSYGLKECAQAYHLASPDRIILDRSDISETYRTDKNRVLAYARQDVEETAALAALVAPTEFYQAQIVPDTYQDAAVCGTGEKINSIMVRHYLRCGEAIPRPSASSAFPGGFTEIRRTGIIRPVVKADVESLYPSLMLTQDIKPKSDRLGIFLPLLRELTNRRLSAKRALKSAPPHSREEAYWDGLQNSFKTLINSFYGYIGGPFYFNDNAAARRITEAGQQVVKDIADELTRRGASVIEIDTDGVYFQPPERVRTLTDEEAFVEEVGSVLPAGIRLAHDGSYAAMISLKIKNYVLLHHDGRHVFKGSSLRSRADEKFGRNFLSDAVGHLLLGDEAAAAALYTTIADKIVNGQMPIEDLAKRERVTQKMLASGLRKRAADALRGSIHSEGDFVSLYQRKDGTLGLADSYDSDEDREYYLERLYKFALRLKDALPDERFHKLFMLASTSPSGQTTLDLFG
jgi:DNA polymerase I